MTGIRRTLVAGLPAPARERLRLVLASTRELRLRRSTARLGLVLVYHRIGEDAGDPDFELDPAFPLELFRRQLEHLRGRYRPVAADRIVEAAQSRRRGEPFPVAVTLDDDLRSHLEVAAPALAERGVPGIAFLTGASLAEPMSSWWADLQRAVDGGRVTPADLPGTESALVAAAVGRRPGALRRLARTIERLPPAARDDIAAGLRTIGGSNLDDAPLSREDMRSLAAAGIAVGFHTLGHYDLRALDDEALARELRAGRPALERAAEVSIQLIAYPHGKCDPRVAEAARRAGFELGFTGEARAVRAGDDSLRLGRLQPVRGSLADFALQLTAALRNAAR